MATYYLIEQDFLEHTEIGNYTGDLVSLISENELDNKLKLGELDRADVPVYKNARCCRAIVRPDILRASFSLISKDKQMNRSNFGFVMKPGHLIFIDSGNTVSSIIKKIQKNKSHGGVKLGRFIYEFIETIIEHDLRYIEEIGDRLIKMESAVVRGMITDFGQLVSSINKEIMTFYRFYTQLVDLSVELQENENDFFNKSDCHLFEKVTYRANQLRDEMRFLKETANHVCDLYANQIDTKMNKVMKILTVVTTIFMPTTVIGSWFGMNFSNMPELTYEYGYLICAIVNVLFISLCWWFLKKKKFF